MGQAVFSHPEQKPCPTPRHGDCTIVFRNHKSLLPQKTAAGRHQLMLSGGSNNVELSKGAFKIPLPSLDQFQNLLNGFLAEIHILVIDNHTRHAHDLVPVLQILKMADIIYTG